jgi:hypothetical protein
MFYEYDMGIFVQNLVAVQLSFFLKRAIIRTVIVNMRNMCFCKCCIL